MNKDWKAVPSNYKSHEGRIMNDFFYFPNFSNTLINYQIQNTKLINSQSYTSAISNV